MDESSIPDDRCEAFYILSNGFVLSDMLYVSPTEGGPIIQDYEAENVLHNILFQKASTIFLVLQRLQ
jgi:hypothetical protein